MSGSEEKKSLKLAPFLCGLAKSLVRTLLSRPLIE
jgi:hypothetical protein